MKHRIPNTSRTFRLGAVIQFVYSRSSSGVIWYVLINKGSTAILLSIYLSVIKTQYYQKAALPSRTLAPERGRVSGPTLLARRAHPPGGFLFIERTSCEIKKSPLHVFHAKGEQSAVPPFFLRQSAPQLSRSLTQTTRERLLNTTVFQHSGSKATFRTHYLNHLSAGEWFSLSGL